MCFAPMPQLVFGIGMQPDGTPVNLYTGQNEAAALAAIDAAGKSGQVNLGFLIENPPPTTTLRYPPPTANV